MESCLRRLEVKLLDQGIKDPGDRGSFSWRIASWVDRAPSLMALQSETRKRARGIRLPDSLSSRDVHLIPFDHLKLSGPGPETLLVPASQLPNVCPPDRNALLGLCPRKLFSPLSLKKKLLQ